MLPIDMMMFGAMIMLLVVLFWLYLNKGKYMAMNYDMYVKITTVAMILCVIFLTILAIRLNSIWGFLY